MKEKETFSSSLFSAKINASLRNLSFSSPITFFLQISHFFFPTKQIILCLSRVGGAKFKSGENETNRELKGREEKQMGREVCIKEGKEKRQQRREGTRKGKGRRIQQNEEWEGFLFFPYLFWMKTNFQFFLNTMSHQVEMNDFQGVNEMN